MSAGSVSVSPRAISGVPRFAPRVDLGSGRVVGFLAMPPTLRPGCSEEDLDPFEDRLDREIAEILLVARAAGTSPVVVQLPVGADVVAWAAHRIRAVRPAMLDGGGRGAGVSLLLGARNRSASTASLERGIAHARRDGFGIALLASGFAPAEVLRLAPDELVLDAEVLAGAEAGHGGALATLEAATALARTGGPQLVADGVRGEAELRDVRARGAVVASGPILAADQSCTRPARTTLAPGLRVRLGATAPGPTSPATSAPDTAAGRSLTLGDVARSATVVSDSATGEDVRAAFADDADCAGVVLVDTAGAPTGYVDRNRFLLRIAGPYGRAVFAHRAAALLADPPTVRPTTTPVRDAVRERLDGDPARRYDDTLLSEPDGRTARVARFADLVRALDPADGSAPPVGVSSEDAAEAAPRRGRHRLVGLRPRAAGVAVG